MQTLSLKPWSEITEVVKKLNPELHKALSEIADKQSQNYTYVLELSLGLHLIQEGKPVIFQSEFLEECEGKNTSIFDINTFLKDFSNKFDHPLGLIEKGVVEIYESNSYKCMENNVIYNFPLSVLKKGDLIGSFGATDVIHNVQADRPLYTYSAFCGHFCVYPLLPKELSGKGNYGKRIIQLCNHYNLRPNKGEHLFSFFPKLIEKISLATKDTIKLILFPDFWFKNQEHENVRLRAFITKIAWIQSREARLNDLSIIPIIKDLGYSPTKTQYLYSEMIVYLMGAAEGKRLILKPVNESSYLFQHYEILKEKVGELYDPILFYFDSISTTNEWGLFPLFIFPTINRIETITSGQKFVKEFQSIIEDTYKGNPLLSQLTFNYEPSKYLPKQFPKRNIYSKLFLTRAILKIQKS